MKSTAKPGKQEVGKRLPKQVRLVPKPTWHQRLEDLNRFKKEHGHYNVPYGYSPNKSLANWVSNVRSQKHSGKIASE
ncbi:MAG: helicase associated domain-containing protein, partial [Thermoguttaceae bacterium]